MSDPDTRADGGTVSDGEFRREDEANGLLRAVTGGVVDLPGYVARLYLGACIAFIVAPILIIVAISFTPEQFLTFPPGGFSLRWFDEVLTSPEWQLAIVNSLVIATGASVIATSIGLSLAFALDRYDVRYTSLLRGIGVLPILIPPVIIGVAFMSYFFLIGISGTILNLIVAHGVFYAPFSLVLISTGLDEMDREVEEAAMNLGATRWQTLRTVTFPIIRSNVFSGVLFAFILSLNEYIIAFLVSGFTVTTVPIKIFSSLRYSYSPTIAAISVLYVVLTTVVVAVVEYYTGGIWD
ncbi:ABC transporter permease [Halorussus sp. AFM4]|uniref:ABC transporter permease n=1 Tax=Halorussus sp. AFM4 TaxID=3421651 RepID=UPI003EB8EC4F